MRYFLFLVVIVTLICSCQQEKTNISNFHLTPSDYIEKITVTGTIHAVKTTYIKTPRLGIIKLSYLSDNGARVKIGDTICILEHPELISRLETSKLSLENLKVEMNRLEVNNAFKLSMLEAQIENNNIQLAINSLDSIQKRFTPPLQSKIISLEQEKAQIEKAKLMKKFNAQSGIVATELRSMKSRIKQQESRIQQAQDQVDLLTIISPENGITIHTESPTMRFMSSTGGGSIGGKIEEGTTVYSNMNLLEMPDLNEMQISVELVENAYKRIEVGQKVYIKSDALKNINTTGSVKTKMLVGKKVTRESNIKNYEVIIEIDSCHSMMSPGLSASCYIIIKEVKDTLVVPTISIFEEDDYKFVYVQSDKKFTKVVVETGLANSSHSIISSGLKAGEIIALTTPPDKMIYRLKSDKVDSTNIMATDTAAMQKTLGDSIENDE